MIKSQLCQFNSVSELAFVSRHEYASIQQLACSFFNAMFIIAIGVYQHIVQNYRWLIIGCYDTAKMSLAIARALSVNVVARKLPAIAASRGYATEASPEDYGYCTYFFSSFLHKQHTFRRSIDPDPLEHAQGREKKLLIARLAGDDVSLQLSYFSFILFHRNIWI